MLSSSFFPFVRNRFYCGKLLTSSDFIEEQKYFNNKRRFLNKLLFGSGVISGFNVYAVDDTTLMIESGVALDSSGREVVLEKSFVGKLSTIEGFNDIKTSKLGLFVEYYEKEINPLYLLAKNDLNKEYENNRINEEVHFTVKDISADSLPTVNFTDKFIDVKVLYEDADFRLKVKIPKFTCRDCNMNVVAQLEKLSDADLEFAGDWVVNVPGFVNDDGDNKLVFRIEKTKMARGGVRQLTKGIRFEGVSATEKTTFVAKADSTKFTAGKSQTKLGENVFWTVVVKNSMPIDLVREQITNISAEQLLAEADKPICVAVIELVKVDAKTYVISSVTRPDVYSGIFVPVQQYSINEMLDFYRDPGGAADTEVTISNTHQESNTNTILISVFNSVISAGVVEIPITQSIKAGKVIYSDEVMHGLGMGDVFVDVGVEYIVQGQNNNASKRIIYGDMSVFKEDLPGFVDSSKAVKVVCEKGTFVVGIRFGSPVNISGVKLRWFAFKTPNFNVEGDSERNEERAIFVKKNTLTVVPNEVVCIDVGFNNMPTTTLKYEVVDKDGGVIDVNGVYNAPNKEGVYEVKISCVNEPDIYTYAYIIVVKKDV
ncbi:MAG: hypothetical protein LBJ38_03280 [Oscillospiraceae bacterium]|jgi:hypothetical protein|nr:hypothetical protein [Oscillospiraceae bacterium]